MNERQWTNNGWNKRTNRTNERTEGGRKEGRSRANLMSMITDDCVCLSLLLLSLPFDWVGVELLGSESLLFYLMSWLPVLVVGVVVW